ncbi:hypothetical protein J4421_05920 [Candidatus Woesearchaeota archaeon]|nr:hypothetical protein [Candidatus Woesearchaeota archaeon]
MLPKLITYTRGFIPLSHIYFIIKAMNEMASELNETKAKIIAYAHHGKKTWWSWSEQEMNTLGKLIWKKTATKKTAEEHFQKIRSFAEKSIETAEKLRKKNLAILSNEQLPKAYQEFYESCKEAHALLNFDIDAIDILPVEFLKQAVRKELSPLKENEFLDIYTKLTTPIHTSYVSTEEKAFLELLERMKSKNVPLSTLRTSPFYKDFQKIISAFWWTCLGWENRFLKKEEDYISDLKGYEQKVKDQRISSEE